jgi:signal transduction histidine kinase
VCCVLRLGKIMRSHVAPVVAQRYGRVCIVVCWPRRKYGPDSPRCAHVLTSWLVRTSPQSRQRGAEQGFGGDAGGCGGRDGVGRLFGAEAQDDERPRSFLGDAGPRGCRARPRVGEWGRDALDLVGELKEDALGGFRADTFDGAQGSGVATGEDAAEVGDAQGGEHGHGDGGANLLDRGEQVEGGAFGGVGKAEEDKVVLTDHESDMHGDGTAVQGDAAAGFATDAEEISHPAHIERQVARGVQGCHGAAQEIVHACSLRSGQGAPRLWGMDGRGGQDAGAALTRRYVLALGLVAVLTVAAQVVVQVALARSRSDAAVIDLAGRQRMLSQRLAALAQAQRTDPGRLPEVRTVAADWLAAHERLRQGAGLGHAGRNNSAAAVAALDAVDRPLRRMTAAAGRLPDDAGAVAAILADEREFLPAMESAVAVYRREAEGRIARLVRLEWSLAAGLLVVLVLEAVVVFRPAVRRLVVAQQDRERLRAQEAETEVLSATAATARAIGQDLHDGLGQTLTALSLQAGALARTGGPEATALASGIAAAITQCRAQARRLAPVEVHVAGLEGALGELAAATAAATGVTCSAVVDADVALPSAMADDVVRIVQEAIANALRHGRARTIRVHVAAGPLVRISDDGRGGDGPPGFGLRSMEARCRRHGWVLSAGPQMPRGWLVAVRPAMPGSSP